MFDLVIRNASLIDGSGAPARPADVGIAGDRIVAVGTIAVDAPTARTIDARGRVVCPGFVDIHTHSDLTLVEDGTGESKLRQGVTTEVVGNCSFSAFPIEPDRLALHADHLARATAPLTPWWTDFDGYADALHERGLTINVAPLAGHGTLRVAAMGVDERPPTADEMQRMERDLDHALEQGAFGMSTGLTHVPSSYGDFDEVAALARVLAARGALYATHSRAIAPDERAAVAEAIDIGRRTGVTVEFSHLAINRPERWGTGDELLAMFDEARRRGHRHLLRRVPVRRVVVVAHPVPPAMGAGRRHRGDDRPARDPGRARAGARRHGRGLVRWHPVALGPFRREQLARRLRRHASRSPSCPSAKASSRTS